MYCHSSECLGLAWLFPGLLQIQGKSGLPFHGSNQLYLDQGMLHNQTNQQVDPVWAGIGGVRKDSFKEPGGKGQDRSLSSI